MPSSSQPRRANVITHIHTDASTAEASELDDRIGAAIRRVDGDDTAITWAECFTPIERMIELVRSGRGSHGPVHLVLVTDHMRARSHHHPLGHLAVAAKERRIALGAELATRTRDLDGCYRHGPEILAYGGPELVDGPCGPYYGLSRQLIEELYDTCLADDRQELCTRRARDLLIERGIAHALSHPLDGHELSFEATFDLISEFSYVETLNGGYFEESARVLDAYVKLVSAILRGGKLPERALTPVARRIVEHILRHGCLVRAWAGSDAHSHDFDRVVVAAPAGTSGAETLRPGDLFRSMLEDVDRPPAPDGEDRPSPFLAIGNPASPLSQLADIIAIIGRNLYHCRKQILSPILLSRVLITTSRVTRDELRERQVARREYRHMLRTQFDPVALLAQVEMPTIAMRTPQLDVQTGPALAAPSPRFVARRASSLASS